MAVLGEVWYENLVLVKSMFGPLLKVSDLHVDVLKVLSLHDKQLFFLFVTQASLFVRRRQYFK